MHLFNILEHENCILTDIFHSTVPMEILKLFCLMFSCSKVFKVDSVCVCEVAWWSLLCLKLALNCSYVQKATVTITKYLFCTLSHVSPLAEV